jgi:hypothetical protein
VGRKMRYVAILGSLMLLQIVLALIVESGFNDLVVRDVTIFLFVASLIFVKAIE